MHLLLPVSRNVSLVTCLLLPVSCYEYSCMYGQLPRQSGFKPALPNLCMLCLTVGLASESPFASAHSEMLHERHTSLLTC